MNTTPALDQLIDQLKTASRQDNAVAAVRTLMTDFVADPEAARQHVPDYEDDDVVLFEDDHVSIWFCRFQPGVVVPPHDHQMSATIAVYEGIERNDFFTKNDDDGLSASHQLELKAGDVVQIAPDEIHGVGCNSEMPSCAIHVYLGKLTTVDRSLFDIAGGKAIPFTDANYEKLTSSDY